MNCRIWIAEKSIWNIILFVLFSFPSPADAAAVVAIQSFSNNESFIVIVCTAFVRMFFSCSLFTLLSSSPSLTYIVSCPFDACRQMKRAYKQSFNVTEQQQRREEKKRLKKKATWIENYFWHKCSKADTFFCVENDQSNRKSNLLYFYFK